MRKTGGCVVLVGAGVGGKRKAQECEKVEAEQELATAPSPIRNSARLRGFIVFVMFVMVLFANRQVQVEVINTITEHLAGFLVLVLLLLGPRVRSCLPVLLKSLL